MNELRFDCIKSLTAVKESLLLFSNVILGAWLIDELELLLARQISVDLILTERLINEVERQPFLLHELLDLRKKGASIFVETEFKEEIELELITDFSQGLSSDHKGHEIYLQNNEWQQVRIEKFREIKKNSKEYRLESEDIDIQFNASCYNAYEKDQVELVWDVKNAKKVWLENIGEVEHQSKLRLQINGDRIFKLKAINEGGQKLSSLKIAVKKRISFQYNVDFFNPASKSYSRIYDEQKKGVFGVIKGQRVRISWFADQMESLWFSEMGTVPMNGEYTYMSENIENFEFKIGLGSKFKTEKIIIQCFPIPLFREKLVTIDAQQLFQRRIGVPKTWNEQFIQHQNFRDSKLFVLQETEKRKKKLEEKVFDFLLNEGATSQRMSSLKKVIFRRLKFHFKTNNSMKGIIIKLKEYYA